jgi:hypothetical protein
MGRGFIKIPDQYRKTRIFFVLAKNNICWPGEFLKNLVLRKNKSLNHVVGYK